MRLKEASVEVIERKVGGRAAVVLRAVCPFCGRAVEREDPSVWWPVEGDCPHFRGFYSGGGVKVIAYFG